MSKFKLHNPSQKPALPEQEVDPSALEAFAAGARHRSGTDEQVPPWEQHDPNEKPRYNVSIRLNEYYLDMLRYVAEAQDISQQKWLQKQLLPVLKRLAIEVFENRQAK